MSETPFTILVVDDNLLVLDTIAHYLTAQGYRPIAANNGNEALELLEKEPIDLVVLDVRMPGITGLEVLKRLRQSHPMDEMPVIMATANGQSDDVVEAFELGANDYVTKPLDFPVVLARIHARLRSRTPAAVGRSESAASPTPSASPFAEIGPGTVLEGKYRLESVIGRGQFGVVYQAQHLQLQKQVAVKLLHTAFDDSEDSIARFQQEGRSACRIQHPNAVSVLDFSVTPNGVHFLVMELLQGHTLEDELNQSGRLSPQRCADILLPICAVLAEAHLLGIIHRDIKPQNIFLHQSRQGEVVKVLDFGVAKLVGESLMNPKLTLEGIGPGTPIYMAPERFSEMPYDGGADVYSLGVMLYEMLVGRPPFTVSEGNPIQVALRHLTETPRALRELNPELTPQVEALVLQTLEKEPEYRPSAEELGFRFAHVLGVEAPNALSSQSKIPQTKAS